MVKLAYYILKFLDSIIYSNIYSEKKSEFLFRSMLHISINGLGYKNIGDVNTSGEKQVIKLINEIYKKSNKKIIIFDVGANIGQYQNMLINELKINHYSIYSFEPAEDCFKSISELNNKNVYNIKLGLGEKSGKNILYKETDQSQLASLYMKSEFDYYNVKNMDITEEISISTIDEFCLEQNIPYINFLKLDIEGHELYALLGAKKFIENNLIDFVQFEFGPSNIYSKTYFKDFFNLMYKQFKLYRITKKT
jgi:FkbM family methyltransferase